MEVPFVLANLKALSARKVNSIQLSEPVFSVFLLILETSSCIYFHSSIFLRDISSGYRLLLYFRVKYRMQMMCYHPQSYKCLFPG